MASSKMISLHSLYQMPYEERMCVYYYPFLQQGAYYPIYGGYHRAFLPHNPYLSVQSENHFYPMCPPYRTTYYPLQPYQFPCKKTKDKNIIRQQSGSHLVPVIIQFNTLPLLKKFPGLPEDNINNHPYLMELKKKYHNWIEQIKRRIPDLKEDFRFDTLYAGISASLPKESIAELNKFPFIKAVYPDSALVSDHDANLLFREESVETRNGSSENNLMLINVPPVREMHDHHGNPIDGRGVRVAVAEKNGISIPRLRFGSEGKVIDQYDFLKNTESIPDFEHGRKVTQIILDVAPNVDILAYRIGSTSGCIAALERAKLNQVNIFNASFSLRPNQNFLPVIETVDTAVQSGITVITASGNNGKNTVLPDKRSSLLITVGATTEDGDQVAKYSDYGISPPLWRIKPDFVAPGTYEKEWGTSFAAPYVSGSVALMKQMYPTMKPNEFKSLLATTATRIREREPGAVFSQGSGRINVFKAITTSTLILPSSLSFVTSMPQKVEAFIIENRSNHPQTYAIDWSEMTDPGEFREVHPPEIRIPAGKAQQVTLVSRTARYNRVPEAIHISTSTEKWHVPTLVMLEPVVINVGSQINSISYSPDGTGIATGSEDGMIKIWDVANESAIPLFTLNTGSSVFSIDYSPDGQKVAAGLFDDKIIIVDVKEGSRDRILQVDSSINSVAYTRDGKRLVAGSLNENVLIWDVTAESNDPLFVFRAGESVVCVSPSLSGRMVATGLSNGTIAVWDLVNISEDPVAVFKAGKRSVTSVSYSPDERYIAAGSSDGNVTIWDMTNQADKPLLLFNTSSPINSVSFSPDGRKLAAGSSSGGVFVWDMVSRSQRTFDTISSIYSVAFNPVEQKLAGGSMDGQLLIWGLYF